MKFLQSINFDIKIFISMLNTQPSLKKLFNYTSKEETTIHTKNIVDALVRVVQHCGNEQTIDQVLKETNVQHVNVKISDEEFWVSNLYFDYFSNLKNH